MHSPWAVAFVPIIVYVVALVAAIPPAGPIAGLIAERSAEGAYHRAFYVGLGAALVEGVYSSLGAAVFAPMAAQLHQIRVIALASTALIFPILGLRFVFWKESRGVTKRGGKKGSLFLGISMAALTPTPLVTWTAVATLFNARDIPIKGSVLPMFGLAAAFGVLTWNTLLIELLKRNAGHLPPARMVILMRSLGFLLLALGLWSAVRLAATLF